MTEFRLGTLKSVSIFPPPCTVGNERDQAFPNRSLGLRDLIQNRKFGEAHYYIVTCFTKLKLDSDRKKDIGIYQWFTKIVAHGIIYIRGRSKFSLSVIMCSHHKYQHKMSPRRRCKFGKLWSTYDVKYLWGCPPCNYGCATFFRLKS